MCDIISEDGFANRFLEIYKNNQFYDITIQVKYQNNGEDISMHIQCHKILLMSSSLFFKDLIISSPGSLIVIEEPNAQLFQVLIEFIYTHKIDLSLFKIPDIVTLMSLSKKYMILELAKYCGTEIFKQNKEDKICCIKCLVEYFNAAVDLNVQCLIEPCLEIIRQHAGSLFRCKAFLSLSSKSMEMIMQEDDLNISEMELYLMVLKWAMFKYLRDNKQEESAVFSNLNCNKVPFYIQCIENSASNILKVENLELNCFGKSQLNYLYKNACCNNKLNFTCMEERFDNFWLVIRKILDDSNITKHIRVLALDPVEFAYKLKNNNIFTIDEFSEILIMQNSPNNLLQPPSGISNIRKPRKVCKSGFTQTSKKLRIHACILFEFISTHVFNVSSEHDCSNHLLESFVIVSEQPIMLMAIILPSKEKKQINNISYEEDIMVEFYKKDQFTGQLNLLATSSYQGRRKYKEHLSLMLKYDIKTESDPFLENQCEIVVKINKLSQGTYIGGLTRTSLNQQSQFIVTQQKIQKGIIAGFGFCFDIGV